MWGLNRASVVGIEQSTLGRKKITGEHSSLAKKGKGAHERGGEPDIGGAFLRMLRENREPIEGPRKKGGKTKKISSEGGPKICLTRNYDMKCHKQ